jgi:hypothetical protein
MEISFSKQKADSGAGYATKAARQATPARMAGMRAAMRFENQE